MSCHTTLSPTQGFHTTSTTTIETTSPKPECSLHLHYQLPPQIFVDPYELVHRSASYAYIHDGTANLELPVSAVDPAGSAVLLDVAANASNVTIELPLHLRYPRLDESGISTLSVPLPIVFWACPSSVSDGK